MAFDKTFVTRINITPDDLSQLGIAEELPELEKWEAAFKIFETDEDEISKFLKRYKSIGIDSVDKKLVVAELFCGKGNSLVALERLGFKNLIGVDLSERLLSNYSGIAKTYVGDCLNLDMLNNASIDIVIIQGGVHHLDNLETSLPILFNGISKILNKNGKFVLIEPWLTPFLQFVHFISGFRFIRMINSTICAFAIMFFFEKKTYKQWLNNSKNIYLALQSFFIVKSTKKEHGKIFITLSTKS